MASPYKTYHITWVTYCSRVSERMLLNKNRNCNPLYLTNELEVEVTGYIQDIVRQDKITIKAYNICYDHVHIIICCKEGERDNIVRKLKGKSTQLFKKNNNISSQFHLWAQKYNYWEITNENQLYNTIKYIEQNRIKHSLSENKGLQPLAQKMVIGTLE